MKHLKIYDNMTDYDAASDNLPITHIAKIEDTGEVIGYPNEEMIAVEYLQGDGSAWIDTGVVIKDNPRVVINIYMTGSLDKDVFGFPSNTQPSFIGNISASSSKQSFQYYRYYTTSSRGSALNSTVPFNTWAEWDMSNVVKCNGSTLATYNRESFAANNQTLRLFNGRGYITTNVVRVGATKIYDGDVLKRDFIPVRLGTVGYMFDKVTKKLFGNAGTGSFAFGSDIVPIEYLENESSSYIDTEYIINSTILPNMKIYIDFMATNKQAGNKWWAHGLGGGGLVFYAGLDNGGNGTTNLPFTYGSGSSDIATTIKGDLNVRYKITLDYKNRTYEVRNSSDTVLGSLTNITVNATSQNSYSPYIFAWRRGTNGTLGYAHSNKIYAYKLYNNNILVRDYVPVRIGTTGYLLDKVEWKLYANAGTGSFTYGNDLRSTRIFTAKQF